MTEEKRDELKVVISLKQNKASVGVRAPECDPAFFTLEGDLNAALKAVPKLVEEAKTRWAQSKQNPKCETPLPSQTQPAPTLSRASTGSSTKPVKQTAQPSMF